MFEKYYKTKKEPIRTEEKKPNKFQFLLLLFINRSGVTALSLNAEAFTNNRTSQAVEPEKLTRKFYKNNSCALFGAGAYI